MKVALLRGLRAGRARIVITAAGRDQAMGLARDIREFDRSSLQTQSCRKGCAFVMGAWRDRFPTAGRR